MRIGVVVHGPEVIDSGKALEWLNYLGTLGEVHARLGGVMGAVAVIDAGLDDRIDIGRRELVSEATASLLPEVDILFLLNLGKTRQSGLAFGEKVLGKLRPPTVPVIQIDDGFVVAWGEEAKPIASEVAGRLSMDLLERPWPELLLPDRRLIDAVCPGESVWIDGLVVGRANSERVVIIQGDNGLQFEGMEVKESGLKRLGQVDLAGALIRSGTVRRTMGRARQLQRRRGSSALLIDHCAEASFHQVAENEDIAVAVTVGDDTTRVAGDMLYRFGIPIIGLTDGDEDGICRHGLLAKGSVVITLAPGNDDVVGAEVRERIFEGRREIRLRDRHSLLDRVLEIAADRLISARRIDD